MEFLSNFAKGAIDMITPKFLFERFQEGQARDEARTIRAEDRADAEKDRSLQWDISQQNLRKGHPGSYNPIGAIGQDSSYVGSSMGQNTGSNSDRKMAELNAETIRLQNQGLRLDNLEKSQNLNPTMLQKPGRPSSGTGFLPGSSQGTLIKEVPQERTTSATGFSEPGAVVSIGHSNFPDNSVMVSPSNDLKQKIEDDPLGELAFHINARTPLSSPPLSALPKGFDMWSWNPVTNVFTPDVSPAKKAYNAAKGKFMRFKTRRVKNTNPFYGGHTIEGYLEEGGN